MSEKIKSFFEESIKSDSDNNKKAIELATAALLIEMIHMDDDVSEQEQNAVFNALRQQFHLGNVQTTELVNLANDELKQATDYGRFTGLINQHFAYSDKLSMIMNLWRVAYSDKQLHRDEAYFVQKISDLINVSQEDFDVCRNKVRDEVL